MLGPESAGGRAIFCSPLLPAPTVPDVDAGEATASAPLPLRRTLLAEGPDALVLIG
jgi:hypothetical protein